MGLADVGAAGKTSCMGCMDGMLLTGRRQGRDRLERVDHAGY